MIMNDDQLKQLWKSQETPTAAFSIDELRKSANKFQRRIAWRNALEYVVSVPVILGFAFYIVKFPYPLMRIGSVMIILGVLVMVWQMYVRASGRSLPSDMADRSCIDFHRDQLIRQRDALRSVWLWYIGPFVPGMIVFRWGVETELGPSAPFARGLGANLMIAAVFLIIIVFNRFGARKLQRQLDQLQKDAGDGQ